MLRDKNEDAYLACRLAPIEQRGQIMSVFIIFHEAYEAFSVSSEPMVGRIKLAWWRERIEELAAGTQPRPHPALLALGSNFAHYDELLAIVNEFEKLLDGWQPKNFAEIEEFVGKTFGVTFSICGKILSISNAEKLGFAYGNLYLLRKFTHNKNLFSGSAAMAGKAEENFAKNLGLPNEFKNSAFAIIISHYQKHQNLQRWRFLLQLFLRAKRF